MQSVNCQFNKPHKQTNKKYSYYVNINLYIGLNIQGHTSIRDGYSASATSLMPCRVETIFITLLGVG